MLVAAKSMTRFARMGRHVVGVPCSGAVGADCLVCCVQFALPFHYLGNWTMTLLPDANHLSPDQWDILIL